MKQLSIPIALLLTTLARLPPPTGAQALAAQSVSGRHRLPVPQCRRRRALRLMQWTSFVHRYSP
jgi:hypothetical protein